jgi:hypothetical protein
VCTGVYAFVVDSRLRIWYGSVPLTWWIRAHTGGGCGSGGGFTVHTEYLYHGIPCTTITDSRLNISLADCLGQKNKFFLRKIEKKMNMYFSFVDKGFYVINYHLDNRFITQPHTTVTHSSISPLLVEEAGTSQVHGCTSMHVWQHGRTGGTHVTVYLNTKKFLREHQQKIDAVTRHKETVSKRRQLLLTQTAVALATGCASSSTTKVLWREEHHMTGSRVLNQQIFRAPSIPHPVSTVSVVHRSFGRYRYGPLHKLQKWTVAPYANFAIRWRWLWRWLGKAWSGSWGPSDCSPGVDCFWRGGLFLMNDSVHGL